MRRATAADRPARASGSLPGVGMPGLLSGPEHPAPLNVALVVDGSYDAAALRPELAALGSWISAHHAAGTRVTVIDAGSASATAPLRASALAASRPDAAAGEHDDGDPLGPARRRPAPARDGRARPRGRRRVRAPSTSSRAAARRPPRPIALKRGGRARVTIDERRPDALAASVARAMMELSGQRERR